MITFIKSKAQNMFSNTIRVSQMSKNIKKKQVFVIGPLT